MQYPRPKISEDDRAQKHRPLPSSSSSSSSSDHEVIVKIDGGAGDNVDGDQSPTQIWRENIWRERVGASSPAHNNNKNDVGLGNKGRGELSLNMDLEMEQRQQQQEEHNNNNNNNNNHPPPPLHPHPHPHPHHNNNPPDLSPNINRSPNYNNNNVISRDLRVSFQTPASPTNLMDKIATPTSSSSSFSEDYDDNYDDDVDDINRQTPDNDDINISGPRRRPSNVSVSFNNNVVNNSDEVLKCTSFQRRPSILRNKTQSRLNDPPPPDKKSDRSSGPLKSGRASGLLEKAPAQDDDDDDETFIDEDVPDHLKKAKLDALTFIQWIILILIVAALICTLVISEWKKQKFRGLQLWKWEVLVLVLICGRLVSGWGIRIVVLLIERNFMLRKRILYFVYGLRKAVQNCIWLGLVLIAWHIFFDKKVEGDNKFLRYVNKIMQCMLAATLLWLVKTLMVKVLASSFHVNRFFDRIQDSLFNQYVIEMLSGPPVVEIQNNIQDEEETMADIHKLQNAGVALPPELKATVSQSSGKSGRGLPKPTRTLSMKHSGVLPSTKNQDNVITIDHLHKLNPKNISAWNMKRLVKIVRHGALSTLDERIQNVSANEDDSGKEIRSEYEAKRAARKIFKNVARPRSRYIYMDDLLRFLGRDEATKAMGILQGSSESERISKTDLKNWVVNAFRERRALALTLDDTKTAVNTLHRMVNVLVSIIIVIICLLILGLASSQFLVAVSSQLVVVTFIFGNSCKTVFEALIFLFVIHPFDVGDRCEIGGVQMIVEEMNILTTVFLRFDCQKIIYPNSTLSTISIHNYYRSPDMEDAIDFWVHITTPLETINLIKQRIVSFIDNKKEHWYANPIIVTRNMDDLHRIQISIWPTHKMNHQNMVERYDRRSLLVEEIVKIVKELDMEYRWYPININIRNMPALDSTRMPTNWTNPVP